MEASMKRIIHDIFEQFKLIDVFRGNFKHEFTLSFSKLAKQVYQFDRSPELDEFIDLMAEEAMRFTEAVIEKNHNYTEYRLVEELKLMNALLAKNKLSKMHHQEAQQVRYQLNELILKHYPALYELSSFGYRLLDRSVNFFTYRFVAAMQEERIKQNELN
jgi:hypothetical protein